MFVPATYHYHRRCANRDQVQLMLMSEKPTDKIWYPYVDGLGKYVVPEIFDLDTVPEELGFVVEREPVVSLKPRGLRQMYIVCGNIGSGKSTIIRYIRDVLKVNEYNIVMREENVPKWKSEGWLKSMYDSPDKYVGSFQERVYADYENIEEEFLNSVGITLVERSRADTRATFVQQSIESGNIPDDGLFDVYQDDPILKATYIYVRATPEECLRRIKLRGREEEKNITLDFLRDLDRRYSDFFGYRTIPSEGSPSGGVLLELSSGIVHSYGDYEDDHHNHGDHHRNDNDNDSKNNNNNNNNSNNDSNNNNIRSNNKHGTNSTNNNRSSSNNDDDANDDDNNNNKVSDGSDSDNEDKVGKLMPIKGAVVPHMMIFGDVAPITAATSIVQLMRTHHPELVFQGSFTTETIDKKWRRAFHDKANWADVEAATERRNNRIASQSVETKLRHHRYYKKLGKSPNTYLARTVSPFIVSQPQSQNSTRLPPSPSLPKTFSIPRSIRTPRSSNVPRYPSPPRPLSSPLSPSCHQLPQCLRTSSRHNSTIVDSEKSKDSHGSRDRSTIDGRNYMYYPEEGPLGTY